VANDVGYGALKRADMNREGLRHWEKIRNPSPQQKTSDEDDDDETV